MKDVENWICFDGPEPESIRPLLDALRELPPATPEDPEEKERAARQFFEKLVARIAGTQAPASGEEGQESDPPVAPIAPIAPIAPVAPIAPANAERRRAKDEITVRSPTLADRLAASPPEEPSAPKAPFEAQGPRATDTGAAPEAPGERATEAVVVTAPLPDLPPEVWARLGRLPFRPASPRVEATTLEVPVLVRNRGRTAPIGDDALGEAGAALPSAGTTVGAAIVPFPPLKLQEYASLHAELAVWPEREGEILLRYYVPSEAARRALEEHWAERLAGNGKLAAVFAWEVKEYSAWLRGSRAGRRG